ncbi:MAG TPA: hypothetical protein VF867_04325 [Arthrobacter sp.]
MPARTAPAAKTTTAHTTRKTAAPARTTQPPAPKAKTAAKSAAKSAAGKTAKPASRKASTSRASGTAARTPAKAAQKTVSATVAKANSGTPAKTKTPSRRRAAKPSGSRPAARSGTPRRKPSRAPKPKALEVLYSGKVFRSRLEARWAVFLDLMQVNWDYEPCHYEIGPDLYYLPDFYLPDLQLWLEVKGAPYLDSASMAKCLGSVAGPQPIPLREYPYTPSEKLLLVGPFHSPRHGLVPVHTLISPAAAGMADLSHVSFGISAGGAVELTSQGPAWDTVAATGVKSARRPTPERLAMLLDPEPHLRAGTTDERLESAYRAAHRLQFDDDTKRVAGNQAGDLMARLEGRRSGRPLGIAA